MLNMNIFTEDPLDLGPGQEKVGDGYKTKGK